MPKRIKMNKKSFLGARFGEPSYERGDLVKTYYRYDTKDHGIGIVISKRRVIGLDKYRYQVYWSKMKRVTTYTEPYLRFVEGAKENGK